MLFGTFSTDEGTKGDVAVAASIILAIDAESIELLFVYSLAQVGCHFRTLNITVHGRFLGLLLFSCCSTLWLLGFIISLLLRGRGL